MSATVIASPGVTFAPESCRVAPAGSAIVSIRTSVIASPPSTSVNPKSPGVKAWVESSFTVTIASVPSGASFTGRTLIVARSVSESGPPVPLAPRSFVVSVMNARPW